MVIVASCQGSKCAKSGRAKKPHVEELFEGSDLDLGLVVVRFYKKSQAVYVMIDDRLPVRSGRYPIFAHNKEREVWWAALMEKGSHAPASGSMCAFELLVGWQHMRNLWGGIRILMAVQLSTHCATSLVWAAPSPELGLGERNTSSYTSRHQQATAS